MGNRPRQRPRCYRRQSHAGNDNGKKLAPPAGSGRGGQRSAIDTSAKRAEYSLMGQSVTVATVGGYPRPQLREQHQHQHERRLQRHAPSRRIPGPGQTEVLRHQQPASNRSRTQPNRSKRVEQVHRIRRADPGSMRPSTDPSQYPDENPIMDKGIHRPPANGISNLMASPTPTLHLPRHRQASYGTPTPTIPMHLGAAPRQVGQKKTPRSRRLAVLTQSLSSSQDQLFDEEFITATTNQLRRPEIRIRMRPSGVR